MNAVDLFDRLGVLGQVRWKSSADSSIYRIESRLNETLRVQVKLPFCGTWVDSGTWSVDSFLASHKPVR